jgi:hypothetical protein
MARKPKRPSRKGQGRKTHDSSAKQAAPNNGQGPAQHHEPGPFFSAETGQTERDDYTYKFPGVDELRRLLKDKRGNLTAVADVLSVSRTTVYDWLQKNPELIAVREEGVDRRLDQAEDKLDELIEGVYLCVGTDKKTGEPIIYKQAPHFKSIEFLLLTQGKKRGYVRDNKPAQPEQNASLWVQLQGLIEQAREAYDTESPETPGPGTVEPDQELDGSAELGARPGEIG